LFDSVFEKTLSTDNCFIDEEFKNMWFFECETNAGKWKLISHSKLPRLKMLTEGTCLKVVHECALEVFRLATAILLFEAWCLAKTKSKK